MKSTFVFLLLTVLSLVLAQDPPKPSPTQADDIPCPKSSTPFLSPMCRIGGYSGRCRGRPVPCEGDGPCLFQFTYDCYLNSVGCMLEDEKCVASGQFGVCKKESAKSQVPRCLLDDKPCGKEGDSCVKAGYGSYCRVNKELASISCDQYLADEEAYTTCVDGLKGFVACRVNSPRCTFSGQICYSDGYEGVCATTQTCSVYNQNTRTRETFECPTGAADGTLGMTDIQTLCAKSSRTYPGGCVAYITTSCARDLKNCPFSRLGVSRQGRKCERYEVPCKKKGTECVEKNGAVGLCKEKENGDLYCHDRSDICPKDTECKLPGASTNDPRQGYCNDDFYCQARNQACSMTDQTECWTYGFKGKCQSSGSVPVTPPGFPTILPVRATCRLEDTPPCSAADSASCVAGGQRGSCGYHNLALQHYCSQDNNEEDCIFHPELGKICHSEGPGFDPRKGVSESCSKKLNQFNEGVACRVTTRCGTGDADKPCFVDGAPGMCQVECRATGAYGSVLAPELCGNNLPSTLSTAAGDALTTRLCTPPAGYPLEKIQGSCAARYQNCKTSRGWSTSCLRSYARVSTRGQCQITDTDCEMEGAFCYENNNAGECIKKDGQLTCKEVSDDCPTGEQCSYKTDSKGNVLPPDAQLKPDQDFVERQGVCDSNFRCLPLTKPCSTNNGKCYVSGLEGSCESKSVEQATQLAACEIENSSNPAGLARCFASYSFCFTGCSYPYEACGAKKRCLWPREELDDEMANNGRGNRAGRRMEQRKRRLLVSELVCKDVETVPALPSRYRGNIVLFEADGIAGATSIRTTVSLVARQSGVTTDWAYFQYENNVKAYVTLQPNAVIDLKRYAALEQAVLRLRSHNDIHDARLVAGVLQRGNGGNGGNGMMRPIVACRTACQGTGYTCTAGGICVGRFEHGTCFDDACICDQGFYGKECAEKKSKTDPGVVDPKQPPPADGILLSQWVFENTPVETAEQFVEAVVEGIVHESVPDLFYTSLKNDITGFVVVRVYRQSKQGLDMAQQRVLLEAWKLLIKKDSLISHTTFAPVLPGEHRDTIVRDAKPKTTSASLVGLTTSVVLLAVFANVF